MTKTKNLGIWMDHASAHVMEIADPMVTNIVECESTHEEKEKTLQKGESLMHKNQQQQSEYYKKLGGLIKNYDDVLLFGPTDAKVELLNILKADLSFSKIKIGIRQTDKMTENQEHAFVREYFSKN